MALQFVTARPLQAGKLAATVVTILFGVAGISGILPNQGLTSLFLVVLLSIGLAIVVTGETLLVGYRVIATGRSLTDQFDEGELYPITRAIEVASGIVWAGGFVYLVSIIPEGPMAGPGAIGLLFMMAGISLVILGGSLLRTLSEYYYYRRFQAA